MIVRFVISLTLLFSGASFALPLKNLPGKQPFLPAKPDNFLSLNSPLPMAKASNLLTLREAVLIALHHNPQLITSINNRKLEYYDLYAAQEAFLPQLSISGSATYTKNDNSSSGGDQPDSDSSSSSKTFDIGPSVSWKMPWGATLSGAVGYSPSSQTGVGGSDGKNTSWNISISQPLLQNFGVDVNEISLRNAKDQQTVDSLNLKKQVFSTLIKTAQDYYALYQAKQSLDIAKQALIQKQQALQTRQAMLKAGRIPRMDLVQARLDITSQQQAVHTAMQGFSTAKTTLLNDLGLPETTDFSLPKQLELQLTQPSLKDSLELATKNNIDLAVARLNYIQQQRNMLSAKNQRRWQLDLKLSRSHQRFAQTFPGDSDQNNTNFVNNTSVSLDLSIPFNQVDIDKAQLSASINQQNAQIAMENAKRSLKTNVITAVNNLKQQWQQLETSKQNLKLNEENVKAAQVRFQYGKLGAFSLSQQQQQLIQAKINLVGAKIHYLEQVMNYQELVGTLLQKWHIQLRVPSHA